MACDLDKIKQDTFDSFMKLSFPTSKKFDARGRMVFDYTTSEKYNTEAGARNARKSIKDKILPIVEEWAAGHFGDYYKKGFIVEAKGHNYLLLKYNFPDLLNQAYIQKNKIQAEIEALRQQDVQLKEETKFYNQQILDALHNRDAYAHTLFNEYGQEYSNIDELIAAMEAEQEFDDSIEGDAVEFNFQLVSTPNYGNYINHKNNIIAKVEKGISKLYNDKRVNPALDITKKVARLNHIKEELEKDIADFKESFDKEEALKIMFGNDFNLIDNLLTNPTLENIFLAKDLYNYLKIASDTKQSNENLNELFPVKYDVNQLFEGIHAKLDEVGKDIETAVDNIFTELLERNSNYEGLQKAFPGKSIEEIKKELLSKTKDINWIESMFFSTGDNISSKNNVLDTLLRLEFEKKQLHEQAKAQKITQRIDALLPSVEKELEKLGKKITSKLGSFYYSGYNYNMFYQKERDGIYKSSLIGKYSLSWEATAKELLSSYNKQLFQARREKDWAKVEQVLINKFNDINDKAEFVNFPLLHDVFNKPEYNEFKRGSASEAAAYKAQLISVIGQEEYENIIETQRNLLDNYLNEIETIIEFKLAQEGVSSVEELSDNAKSNLEITKSRLSPLAFIDSYLAGRKGMIEYTVGTQSNEKPSYIKYNAFYPRAKTLSGFNTDYYDADFDAIEKNPVLYEFWKTLRDAAHLINENLIDSDLKLSKNSLLYHKKQFTEETINKDFKYILGQSLRNAFNIKQLVKDIISAKEPTYNQKTEEVVLPGEIKTFEAEVSKDFEIFKTELANIRGHRITNNTVIDWATLPNNEREKILELVGQTNAHDMLMVMNKSNRSRFTVGDMIAFSERKVMEQQTNNLPKLMKAFLELSAEHKARTEYRNEANIYLEKSAEIITAKGTAFQPEKSKRNRELGRQKFFYDKVILNKNQKDHSGNLSKVMIKDAAKADFKALGRHFYKNFTADEKRIYDSAVQRLRVIDKELEEASETVTKQLLKEKADLEARIRILGKDYMFSALFDNVVNNLSVKVGLGYNIPANIRNKIQGLTSILSRDGEFWTKGNIYPANHFTSLNKLRFINPSYKSEWDKATLFISQLNLIQDGTNELQRAESRIKNKARILSPMYGTEVVEYYNQVPGILAMAMDMEVTSVDGTKKVPLFDGSEFPAYENIDGKLQLKPEFRNEENIKHFELMDSDDMINWKSNVNDMIRSLHGDYSKTGVTQIKGSIYTKPFMLFKTWLPKYFSSRYRYNQLNIKTGEYENGYLLSSFLNRKTSVAGGLMLGVTGLLGIASTSPAIIAAPIFLGVLGAGLAIYHRNKPGANGPIIDPTEPILIGQQAMFVLQMLRPDKLIEVPVNTILGREFIKSPEVKLERNLTKQELKDIRLMARNMQWSIIMMLLKVGVQALLADNEEDEPKGKPGTEQRRRFEEQKRRREEYKVKHNIIENLLTGMYHETSLAVEPTSLMSTLGSKNTLEGPFDKLTKASVQLVRYGQGDEIQKGERAGQSKLGNALRKTFLPGLFRDLGHDTWRGGFESLAEREWITNEGIDGIFDTDYKLDKKNLDKIKKQAKLKLVEEYEKENDVQIEELTQEEQDKIEKKMKKTLKKEYGKIDRKKYDDDQNKIE